MRIRYVLIPLRVNCLFGSTDDRPTPTLWTRLNPSQGQLPLRSQYDGTQRDPRSRLNPSQGQLPLRTRGPRWQREVRVLS